MVGHAVLFVSFQGVGEISGHVILQLQNTNDLAALRCINAEIAELARSEPRDTCLKFIHFDIQSRNQDIWLPFMRAVTPAVCPRLFEFLTTLTLGALGRNHIVSTVFGSIAKKRI